MPDPSATTTEDSAHDAPAPKTLYLIDGHAQFFRAYHSIPVGMSSPVTQEPTNLTFGFVGMLIKLFREHRPDYLAVVIDVSGDRESFRSQIYEDYKANRAETPDDFHPQVERCLSLLETMGVPVIGEEAVEADDVIATLVRRLQAQRPDLAIRIVSKDKDLTQLLSDNVELFDVHTDRTVTAEDIFKTEGVTPDQVVDILALMGDSVDNIPGVPGIGPKTAAKLILQYGSIDNLLAHLHEIKGKRRENLEAHQGDLPRNVQLVRLKDDVEVDFELDRAAIELEQLPVRELIAAFRQLGFNRHADDLIALTEPEPDGGRPSTALQRASAQSTAVGATLFDEPVDPAAPSIDGKYQAVTTLEQLDRLVQEIKQAGVVALDTETDSVVAMQAVLCGMALATQPKVAFYIPVRSPEPGDHLDTATVIDRLRPVLEDPAVVKVGHNLKYDQIVLRRHGVKVAGVGFDTMIASYVVDATRSSHKLDVLALACCNHTCIPLVDLIGKGKSERGFDTVPLEQAVPYSAEDADIALRLRDVFAPQIEQSGLQKLFDEVEMPLVDVLSDLEFNGIIVDQAELNRQRARLAERIEELRRAIQDGAPHPFNPDSPKQLSAALFNRPDMEPPGLGLPVQKRGKTGPSTDIEVLERLSAAPEVDSPLPALIVEYRQLTKLVNTYLIALVEAIHPETGRVHASFNQTVAATGRLSSSDPNLQNIPIRTDVGREIRRAFRAAAGNVLLTADYSQIELRLLAHLSEDPALIEAFHQGADIHTAVASEVFGVDPEDVTPTQRNSAKMVNFGIVYGITPYGLARRLGPDVPVTQASQIITDYKARFSGIDWFLHQCVQMAVEQGYVETILGRRRLIPEVLSRTPQRRALGERMAINTAVQGSAADLIKVAMIDLHRSLPERFPQAKLVLQIHDELVFEVPELQVEPLRDFVVQKMASAMTLKVDLVVETAWSQNWIDAK